MRKVLLFILLFFCLTGLFAQNYPEIMNNGTFLINTGIGFGGRINDNATMLCPPLTVSFDVAIPIAGLPFTIGIITGYFSEEFKNIKLFNFLPVAGRIAYHLGFNVPRLDTYAVLTLGSVINFDGESKFWFGLGVGGRYFFHPNIGAYLEAGFDTVQNVTFGLTCKI